MTQKEQILAIPNSKFIKLVITSTSKRELCEKLKVPYGGQTTNLIKTRMNKLNLKFKKRYIHKRITKICPVCKTPFETYNGSRGEQQTCSYSCSNTYFRSGVNNGMHQKSPTYRTVCFATHGKKCAVCSETRVMEVHHYDENHNNNDPKNLVPLCPTCHRVYHSNYQSDIKPIIDKFVQSL